MAETGPARVISCVMPRSVFSALLLAILALLALAPVSRAQTLQLPPFPADLDLTAVEGLYRSAAYRVEVRRTGTTDYAPCFVFETRNDWVYYDFFNSNPARRNDVLRSAIQFGSPKADIRTASFAQFSFADTAVDVRITLLTPGATANTVTIRPLRHGHRPTISADRRTITFTLPAPQKISVEINDRLNPLFLFADAPDTPDPTATYYYGPGLHRIPGDGTLTVRSNERVYLAAGAIVEGRILVQANSANITIRGRGILSVGEWPHPVDLSYASLWPKATIRSSGTHHLTIEGLTIVQSTAWQIAIEDYSARADATHDNHYLNLKMVSFAGNTDGIWVTGYNNRVRDCFIFNNDDAFVCKGGGQTTITDCVVWGGPWGHLLLLHTILGAFPAIDQLTLDGIDQIGREGSPEVIWASGSATRVINNITVRNVRVEERRRPGNSNNSSYNAVRFVNFNTTDCDASISNVLFENISLDQRLPDEGYLTGSATRPYSNITFKNFTMGGQLILSAADSRLTLNSHTTNVRFLPPDPPSLTLQPVDRVVAPGAAFFLQAAASGADLTYQWSRDGALLVGETRRALFRPAASAADTGTYAVRVSSPAGTVTSASARVTLDPAAARLVNLSCRTALAPGAILIPGFTLAGTGRKTVLIRAAGPALSAFGLTGALADPRLRLYRDATLVASNDDWDAARIAETAARVGAFPFPSASRDAALLATLDAPGAYTVQVDAATGSGIVLVELYDADTPEVRTAQLGNVSVRGAAGTGTATLLLGLVVEGRGTRPVLVRGGGPALAAFGVTSALGDPRLDLLSGPTTLQSNDNWSDFTFAPQLEDTRVAVGAFSYAAGSRDAALLAALAPGAYSVQVGGTGTGAGEALVEVYAAP